VNGSGTALPGGFELARDQVRRSRRDGAATPERDHALAKLAAVRHLDAVLCAKDFLARLAREEPAHLQVVEQATPSQRVAHILMPSGVGVAALHRKIDPDRYPLHRVEFAAVMFHPGQVSGMDPVGRTIGLTGAQMAELTVRDAATGEPAARFGDEEILSASLPAVTSTPVTAYVDAAAGHLYLYRRLELSDGVRGAALRGQLRRENAETGVETTYAALIPHPRWRFARDRHQMWHYTGDGAPTAEVGVIRKLLAETPAGENLSDD
jgi:hypothetical protein